MNQPGGQLTSRLRFGGSRIGFGRSRIGFGSISRLASCLCAVTLVVPAATSPTWTLRLAIHYLPPANSHSQYDVVFAWPGQVWFLGGSNIVGHGKPKVERLHNGKPQSLPLPPGPHSWITAASAPSRNDIWAVTFLGGSVLHWNGSAWKTAPRGNWKTGTRFTGITALSPTNVWVFGTSGRRIPGAGTWHFDGTKWTSVNGVAGGIFQANAAARTDIWGIGNEGRFGNALLHFGGSAWRRVRPAALTGFTYTHVLALSRSNVWVAGSVAGVPKLGHFTGHGWNLLRMPGKTPATGMCRDGRAGIWVIANSGAAPSVVLDRSRTGTWTRSLVSHNAANQVLACALVPGTMQAWGAGKAAAPQGSAAAAYHTG